MRLPLLLVIRCSALVFAARSQGPNRLVDTRSRHVRQNLLPNGDGDLAHQQRGQENECPSRQHQSGQFIFRMTAARWGCRPVPAAITQHPVIMPCARVKQKRDAVKKELRQITKQNEDKTQAFEEKWQNRGKDLQVGIWSIRVYMHSLI